MLGDEDGMIPHRGLLAVVGWLRVGQTALDELPGVLKDSVETALAQIVGLLAAQSKAAAKPRPTQRRKQFIHVAHIPTLSRPVRPTHISFSRRVAAK